MVLYWRGHEDYDDALRLLGSCAYGMTPVQTRRGRPRLHSRNPERPSAPDGLLWSEIYVREGEGWQIRVSTLASKTPLPAATAETK